MIKGYFPGSHTSKGYYSLWENALTGIEDRVIVLGGYGGVKDKLMKFVKEKFLEKGYEIEVLYCAERPGEIDGVIWREGKYAIYDGSHFYTYEKDRGDIIFNIQEVFDKDKLEMNKEAIEDLTDKLHQIYNDSYKKLSYAKKIHDDLELLHIAGMEWDSVDKMTDDLVEDLFKDIKGDRKGIEYHRFASSINPRGAESHLDEIISGYEKRFIIKGRAGTGKSVLTKKISAKAIEAGFDTELYHCSFDPESVDNLWIPELKLCSIDGTPPHEKDPEPGDIVIDMFEFMNLDIYSENADKIKEVDKFYYENFLIGLNSFKKAEPLHIELENIYNDCIIEAKLQENLKAIEHMLP